MFRCPAHTIVPSRRTRHCAAASRAGLVTVLLATGACDNKQEGTSPEPTQPQVETTKPVESESQKLLTQAKSVFKPLPRQAENPNNPITDAKIKLGRRLYYEKRLSKNHDISCNSCHSLSDYGIDVRAPAGKRATSEGHKGQFGDRNSPTVYNAAAHLAQFWDGRAKDVEEQAKGPILNPVEMATPSEAHAILVLKSIPGYEELFKQAFPDAKDPMSYDNLANAIGAFERKLFTPAAFDKYLGGDETALNEAEKKGLQEFMQAGCIVCHSGSLLGGAMYQKLGLIKPYPTKDEGRAKISKNPGEKHFFKVPSLRNIDKTGPYLHDGSLASLEETVAIMAEHQSGKKLEPAQVSSIVTFMRALTGPLPTDYIKEPEAFASGPDTPKPDPS